MLHAKLKDPQLVEILNKFSFYQSLVRNGHLGKTATFWMSVIDHTRLILILLYSVLVKSQICSQLLDQSYIVQFALTPAPYSLGTPDGLFNKTKPQCCDTCSKMRPTMYNIQLELSTLKIETAKFLIQWFPKLTLCFLPIHIIHISLNRSKDILVDGLNVTCLVAA